MPRGPGSVTQVPASGSLVLLPPAWGGLAGLPLPSLPRGEICGGRRASSHLQHREGMLAACWIRARRDREGMPLAPSLPALLQQQWRRRISPRSSSGASREPHAELPVSSFPESIICTWPPRSREAARCGAAAALPSQPSPFSGVGSWGWYPNPQPQVPQGGCEAVGLGVIGAGLWDAGVMSWAGLQGRDRGTAGDLVAVDAGMAGGMSLGLGCRSPPAASLSHGTARWDRGGCGLALVSGRVLGKELCWREPLCPSPPCLPRRLASAMLPGAPPAPGASLGLFAFACYRAPEVCRSSPGPASSSTEPHRL